MSLFPLLTKQQKIELLRLLEEKARREGLGGRVFGIVCPNTGLTHCIQRKGNEWVEVQKKPHILIAKKLERAIKSNKRFIVIIGGRGSGKSIQVIDICAAGVIDYADKVYCLREFQNSISESMHSTIKEEIDRLSLDEFEIQNNEINHSKGGGFRFKGLARNPSSIKSAHGFRRFVVEEAQFLSSESLTALTPTARNKAKAGLPSKFIVETEEDENKDIEHLNSVQMIFVGNPGSSEDPFSQRFIKPFQSDLEKHGYAEDDLHLIIMMNYDDNPWYEDSGLEQERAYDFANKPRAEYDHVWKGKYNDSVEGSIILPEWFDACIDAHKKLNVKPRGNKVYGFDPADTGPDSKGYAFRFGGIFYDVGEIDEPDINSSADAAAEMANKYGADMFTWDCDGMGVGLQRQFNTWFSSSRVQIAQFKGSQSPRNPDSEYMPPDFDKRQVLNINERLKTNKNTFKNRRAQNYWKLRDMCYMTYRAVKFGEMCDPDLIISFSSQIKLLEKLRSEICRIPKKQGVGMIQIMDKKEMLKLKIKSPGMADSVMMALDEPEIYDYTDDHDDDYRHDVGAMGY